MVWLFEDGWGERFVVGEVSVGVDVRMRMRNENRMCFWICG